MAPRIRVSPEAERDLDGILDFIASDNPSAASSFAQSFERSISQLAELPYMGPTMQIPLRRSFRKVTVPPYLVVYRVVADEVQIVRIVHGSRDLRNVLKNID